MGSVGKTALPPHVQFTVDLFKLVWGPPDPRFNETGILNPYTDLPHIYWLHEPRWGVCYADRNPRDSAWAYYLRHAVGAARGGVR